MSGPTLPTPMSFGNLLRGRVAERILATLLERGGYRVTRLGIEELFDEIKYLSIEEYLRLGLPKPLRALPDLLIADPQVSWARLVEVKYRRSFDRAAARELYEILSYQQQFWPETYTVLMIAEPFVVGGRFHQDYIRWIRPGEAANLTWVPPFNPNATETSQMEMVWDRLPTIASFLKVEHFDRESEAGRLRSQEFYRAMDYITGALKELKHF